MLFLTITQSILFSTFAFMNANADNGWDYYGSGRDHPYSAYIDRRNYIGPADYSNLSLTALPVEYPQTATSTSSPVVPPLNEYTVYIPDETQGGYIAVVLKRSGGGFIGPLGEYYPEFPKTFQLEMKYGKS